MDDIRVLAPSNQILNIVWKEVLEPEGLPVDQQLQQERMGGDASALWDADEEGDIYGYEDELLPNFDFAMDFEQAEMQDHAEIQVR